MCTYTCVCMCMFEIFVSVMTLYNAKCHCNTAWKTVKWSPNKVIYYVVSCLRKLQKNVNDLRDD